MGTIFYDDLPKFKAHFECFHARRRSSTFGKWQEKYQLREAEEEDKNLSAFQRWQKRFGAKSRAVQAKIKMARQKTMPSGERNSSEVCEPAVRRPSSAEI